MRFIVYIIAGLVAGYLAGLLWKGRGFGFIGNLLIGICGAFVGGFLLPLLGFSIHGFPAQVISAVAGALLLLWIISLIKK